MIIQEKPIHIDIRVKLTEVKVVFSVASLSFEGDLPASLFHLQLIVNDISNWKAKSQVVVVFHTNARHVTVRDQAYNTDRNIATGNPHKKRLPIWLERYRSEIGKALPPITVGHPEKSKKRGKSAP